MLTATIFDIQRTSMVDGPGIRTTVFFKGCNLHCAWCHNPESQNAAPQMLFYRDKCTGCGKCAQVCPHALQSCDLCGKCTIYCPTEARKICGKEYTVEEILHEVEKDKLFYDTSGGGVTFSGGECMLQIDFLEAILQACCEKGLSCAVDTAGAVAWERFARVLPYTDLFLYDIKCMDPKKHKEYVGADNTLILSNLARLLEAGAPVWIRVPVIAGVNDTVAEMEAIRDFLHSHGKVQRVELLPYHRMGENKAAAANMVFTAFDTPTKESMDALRAVFA